MSVKLLTEHNLGFLSLKKAAEARLSLYTCQNATLLEITCHSSYVQERKRELAMQAH